MQPLIEDYDSYMKNHDKPKTLLIDFDDVMVESAIKQFTEFKKYPDFEKYFKPIPENTDIRNYVNNRQKYYFEDLMLDTATIDENYIAVIKDIYSNNFYDDLEPTPLAIGLKQLIQYKPVICDKFLFISRDISEKQSESKIKWLVDFFGLNICEKNIEYYSVNGINEKKSDVIKNNNLTFTTYIEDSIENIKDVFYNCDIHLMYGVELIIPKRGYNKDYETLTNIFELFNSEITFVG